MPTCRSCCSRADRVFIEIRGPGVYPRCAFESLVLFQCPDVHSSEEADVLSDSPPSCRVLHGNLLQTRKFATSNSLPSMRLAFQTRPLLVLSLLGQGEFLHQRRKTGRATCPREQLRQSTRFGKDGQPCDLQHARYRSGEDRHVRRCFDTGYNFHNLAKFSFHNRVFNGMVAAWRRQ